ncbi:Isoaspartyl peptidase/L-asparaginase, variant 2 [Chamberlinius hualienensis]
MDAIIMTGHNLNVGAVASVVNIANPIQLARMVMEKTDHALIVGSGANKFASKCGMKQVNREALVTENAFQEWADYKKYPHAVNTLFCERQCDTVGAVALDGMGHVACGTSTGGITAKMAGRVGDAPIVGCGAYCDDEVGGVSCTGHGESILKVCLAKQIIEHIKSGQDANSAVTTALHSMQQRVNGQGGAISLSRNGDIGLNFTTKRMAWASIKNDTIKYGLNINDRFEEKFISSNSNVI